MADEVKEEVLEEEHHEEEPKKKGLFGKVKSAITSRCRGTSCYH